MTKGIMASMLALSLAFTSLSTTPVRAGDSGEIGRFLLGAGALFIIGNSIHNSNRNGNHNTNRHTVRRNDHNTHNNRHVTRRNNHNNHFVQTSRRSARAACVRHNRYGKRYISRRCMSKYGY